MKIRIGVVGVPDGWSSERLADAVAAATGERRLIEMKRTRLDLASGALWDGETNLAELDAIIVKKIGGKYSIDFLDRLESLRYLNERGLPVFSRPLAIIRVLDRLACTVTLRVAGVPMPETTITEDLDQAQAAVEAYGKAVFKPLYSTKARGMALIETGRGARDEIETFQADNQVMYIQKAIDLPGQDLGVVFLGGDYLATYARRLDGGSWTTSTAFGGRYQPHRPTPEIIELAARAQALFGLDFTCVDVAETRDGPVVFEVSAFGGFRGVSETTQLDVARRYVDHVLKKIGR